MYKAEQDAIQQFHRGEGLLLEPIAGDGEETGRLEKREKQMAPSLYP
jgi:hypothetical protein